jgi:ferredoxin-NADP reductase
MKKVKCTVKKIKKETPDVVTVYFLPSVKTTFKAGQFISLHLKGREDFRFYSLSSGPRDKLFSISVKKIGSFSSALHKLRTGDAIHISGPYGSFYPKDTATEIILFAAGIGIVPFISIIKGLMEKTAQPKISLFYSNKTFKDIAFFEFLNGFERTKKLYVRYFLTRETKTNNNINDYRRMRITDVKTGFSKKHSDFFICGSESFIISIKGQLLRSGFEKKHILTETFY